MLARHTFGDLAQIVGKRFGYGECKGYENDRAKHQKKAPDTQTQRLMTTAHAKEFTASG